MSIASDIERFFADRTVQGVIEASRETQPLRICYPTEVPVSRFLAWLLDPTEGHGLNGMVLRRLLTACWDTAPASALSLNQRRQIAPSRLATQSFADVVIDREVKLTAASGRLDVLVLIPGMRLLVAIENKFGARESANQLQRYRDALDEQFHEWHRVLIYLDLNGAQPTDPSWIGLDYDWLIDELRIAEKSTWLGEEPRRSIQEFRLAIDHSGFAEELPGIEEHQLLDMVLNHQAVFEIMGAWSRSKASRTRLGADIFAGPDPVQRLFPVYCRRSHLWQNCIPLIAYAALRKAARDRFADLAWDPKRSAFYFTLKRWDGLKREGPRYWPIQVMVREQFGVPANERFVVSSLLHFGSFDESHVEQARAIAVAMRRERMSGRKMATGVQTASLRSDYANNQQAAAVLLCDHLDELSSRFASLANVSSIG
ncbi:hypothetical protein E4L96_17165 [Massilia arenosa]|uniref:PD-(D/E)XK nuclease family protein n=1 Tax=Zemynaea arenosa TaxID=2561931 RepID=A0A4Y9S3R6_9BURK|nr:PD-(D/E)XK nuclease family protein [Massilia arenosa]TFW16045.1 hypothetical protein E4L96_17165 [Massilia arenosa]